MLDYEAELEKQKKKHEILYIQRMRQYVQEKIPTIRSESVSDDEDLSEEVYFSPPSSKVLGSFEIIPTDLNKSDEKRENSKEQSNEKASAMKKSDERDRSQKDPSTMKNQLDICLAAGNKVFDLIDELGVLKSEGPNKLHPTFIFQLKAHKAMKSVVLSQEVSSALKQGQPVVALESTIITHGMPYPENLSTAKAVESLIRDQSVVPATIAILDGVIRVGLTESELDTLSAKRRSVRKCSVRDLPLVVSQKLDGATTVASTMHIANLAGIRVFVTGGLGGVHRGGHESFDISADLITAGRVPVLVVCAGVKSVLDIPRTLEYLETQGVCVAAYKTDEFPAFFTSRSGSRAPVRVDTPEEAAGLIQASLDLDLNTGVVLGVPIEDQDAAEGEKIEDAITNALQACNDEGIDGPSVTPFLLKRVAELTGGDSLEANIRLLKANARVGCEIAKSLCQKQI